MPSGIAREMAMRLLFVGLVFSVEILSPVGAVEGKIMSCIVIVSPEREREHAYFQQ